MRCSVTGLHRVWLSDCVTSDLCDGARELVLWQLWTWLSTDNTHTDAVSTAVLSDNHDVLAAIAGYFSVIN
jgi:hypothetical protein